MSTRQSKYDPRLLGTWKSDTRRTFREFKLRPGSTPKSLRKLKRLFGKLVVRFDRRKMYSNYDGTRDAGKYQVLGRDSESVVIRFYNDLWQEFQIQPIHFEGGYYWIWAYATREYFRRVAPRASQ